MNHVNSHSERGEEGGGGGGARKQEGREGGKADNPISRKF